MGAENIGKDLIGGVFHRLTVVKNLGNGEYECKCKCGNTRIVTESQLKYNKVKACIECSAKGITSKRLEDLSGKRFGKLEVVRYLGNKKWLCKCDCGASVEVFSSNLKKENGTRSCVACANLGKVVDLKGKRFGKVKVIKYLGDSKWRYLCDCGNYGEASYTQLINWSVVQCDKCNSIAKRKEDLTGRVFGAWEVLEYIGGNHCYYRCKCLNCGRISDVTGNALRTGKSKSCGCNQLIDLTGRQINEYTVLGYAGDSMWKCQCSCGNIRLVHGWELRTGRAKSCGCKKWEYTRHTLLNKYGEIAPLKIGNPRSSKQIEALSSRDSMREFIDELGVKVKSWYLAEKLGIGISATLKALHKFGLEDLVEISPSVSKYEKEIYNYIKNIVNEEIIQSDRRVLKGKELDIYIPSREVAIEFNGTYWHSDIYKNRDYHQNKTIMCAKQGIRLIHIFEYEWLEEGKREKLKAYLKDILSDEKERIYGRLTNVNKIESKEVKAFLDKYHLQGSAQASIAYGIYNDSGLLGVMTLGKPRFNKEYEYEIIRVCWKPGILVIGGLEKLFKAFIEEFNPASIVTYSDIAKFTGSSYLRLGFKTDENSITSPNYVWVKPSTNEVITRYQAQKHKLVENRLGTNEQTEAEIMENIGFLRVYDAGNLRLQYKK